MNHRLFRCTVNLRCLQTESEFLQWQTAVGYCGPRKKKNQKKQLSDVNPELSVVLSFKPWVGHNVALHAALAARSSAFLLFAFSIQQKSATGLPQQWQQRPDYTGSRGATPSASRKRVQVVQVSCQLHPLSFFLSKLLLAWKSRGFTFSWWGCYGLCLRPKPIELARSFYSALVCVPVFMALSTVFHSINSLDNSPLSHSVLLVLLLPFWSFQLYISLWQSPSALI